MGHQVVDPERLVPRGLWAAWKRREVEHANEHPRGSEDIVREVGAIHEAGVPNVVVVVEATCEEPGLSANPVSFGDHARARKLINISKYGDI